MAETKQRPGLAVRGAADDLGGSGTQTSPPVNSQPQYVPQGVWVTPHDGSRYFEENNGRPSFQPRTLARDIVRDGPLTSGADHRIWAYQHGVWRPADRVIHERAADLMGERFRVNHVKEAEAIIRALEQPITCDPIPEYINFRNGLYKWFTGEWYQHSPKVRSTVQLATDWRPDAKCPEFDSFLASVVPDDIVPLVWELIGYLMYNGNPLHKAVMLHGTGRNGKGTFLRTITTLLGRENVTAVSLQALASERFGPAGLFGKLANIAGDIDGTYLEQTAMFKAITGEDVITAEYKFKDAFEFTPYAVPVFSANKIPGSADTTVGYFSRFVVITFPNDFTGREDRSLDLRLQTPDEIAGIAVKGAAALRDLMVRGNFPESASAKAAMQEFRRRVDQVQTWLEERDWKIDTGTALTARRDTLYDSYKSWADDEGCGKLRASEFYDRLRALGCKDAKIQGQRCFKGIRQLTADEQREGDSEEEQQAAPPLLPWQQQPPPGWPT